jgi:hypothetical protein
MVCQDVEIEYVVPSSFVQEGADGGVKKILNLRGDPYPTYAEPTDGSISTP